MGLMSYILPIILAGAAWWLNSTYLSGEQFDPDVLIRGHRVLVTGATSGIGKVAALEYCRLGADVVVTGRREHLLREVVDKCTKLSPNNKHGYISADMENVDGTDSVIKFAVERLGGLDYLILNHAHLGIEIFKRNEYNQADYALLRKVLDINFFSFVMLLNHAMPYLLQSAGKVAVVSSISGRGPELMISTYVASKHAVEGYFKSLDLENYFHETNVSITTIIPGYVDTSADSGDGKGLAGYMKGTRDNNFDPIARAKDGYFMEVPGTVEGCADVIIKSTALRVSEEYYPSGYRVWWPILKFHIWPDWMKSIIRNYRIK